MGCPSAEFTLAENTSKQAERALEEAEIALLEHANKAFDLLKGKSPTADYLISMMDSTQEPTPEEDLVRLTALRAELESAATEKVAAAADKRTKPKQIYKGQTISKRAMTPGENMAKKLEQEAAAMMEVTGNLHKSIHIRRAWPRSRSTVPKGDGRCKGGRTWDSLRYMTSDT